jgi:hypothetical protein
VKVELPKDGFDAVEQYKQIKTSILKSDLPRILRDEQKQHDFPKDYDLIMTAKGRQSKRKLYTLNPNFFNIGNVRSPTTFEFVAGDDWEIVVEAIRFAVQTFIRRAPARTGRYINSLDIQGKGSQLRGSGLNTAVQKYDRTDRIYVGPTVDYASTIEAGHFTGYYQNALRGGIIAYVVKQVRLKYGANISCRMIYMNLEGGRLMQPVLEFGVAGAFASNDARPGQNQRRRNKQARRRR